MTLDTILKHLHAFELPTPFPVGPVIVYLADAPGEPLTLVDTGPHTPGARAALESHLASLGYQAADLQRIVVTHAHADHFGLAADLAAVSGSLVLTHPWNVPTLGDYDADRQRRTDFFADLLREAAVPDDVIVTVGRVTSGMKRFAQPVTVDSTLGDGDMIHLAGHKWEVLHTPGHARGLICLYERSSETLLSSDHLLADISSNPVIEPPPPGDTQRPRSLALYWASLQRVASLGVNQAFPSHGPVIHNVVELVNQRLDFHKRRLLRVMDALRDGARTTWDVTYALFPDRSPLDTFLAISEVIGHLDLLEMEGKIVARKVGGVVLWKPAT